MQFSLKRLFAAVLASALLMALVQIVIERRPQLSVPVLLVLAAPATMGLGIFVLSITMMCRQARLETGGESTASKYRNLAAIGVFATMPLVLYIGYCCIAAGPRS